MNGSAEARIDNETIIWTGSPAKRAAILTPFIYAGVIYALFSFYPPLFSELQTLVEAFVSERNVWTENAGYIAIAVFMVPGLWNYLYQTTTVYTCTSERLIIEKGIFVRTEDEVELYRVIDVFSSANLFQMLFGVGTVRVKSTDQTGNVIIPSILNPSVVRNVVRTAAENCKTQRGTLRVLNELGPVL